MSGSASQQNFHAREFKEKQGFVVKKSTKILTVPEQFNLNTDRRLQERSLSKGRDTSKGNKLSLDQEIKSFQGIVQRDSGRDSAKLRCIGEETSLLDKLIREYNLENVF